MNTNYTSRLLVCLSVVYCLPSFAAGAATSNYVVDGNGQVVRNSNNECWQAQLPNYGKPLECTASKTTAAAQTPPIVTPPTTATSPAAITPAQGMSATAPIAEPKIAAAIETKPEPLTQTLNTPAVVPAAVAQEKTKQKIEGATIKGDALFDLNRAKLKPTARKQLAEVASKIKGQKAIEELIITGRTDTTGAERYNKKLSKRRAEAVKNFLLSEGVVSKRVVVEALGEEHPVASNKTAAGRAQNRRVDISVSTAANN